MISLGSKPLPLDQFGYPETNFRWRHRRAGPVLHGPELGAEAEERHHLWRRGRRYTPRPATRQKPLKDPSCRHQKSRLAISPCITSFPALQMRRSYASTTALPQAWAIGRSTCQRLKASECCASTRAATAGRMRLPGPYTLDMMAADVLNLLNALEIDQVHFCGVSLGGQIAQTFTLAYPEPCRLAHLGQHDLRIHGCAV